MNRNGNNVSQVNSKGINFTGNRNRNVNIEPEGDPPMNALMDSDGYYLVDKNGKYLTTEE